MQVEFEYFGEEHIGTFFNVTRTLGAVEKSTIQMTEERKAVLIITGYSVPHAVALKTIKRICKKEKAGVPQITILPSKNSLDVGQ